MYVRYTQPPGDSFDWYEDYLQDDEEIDVKAGGGQVGNAYNWQILSINTDSKLPILESDGLHPKN